MKMTSFGAIPPCILVEVELSFIVLMMEAVGISETSVYFHKATSQTAIIFNR
jgi:hypothetical protein